MRGRPIQSFATALSMLFGAFASLVTPARVHAAPAPDPLIGTWTGTVRAPQGETPITLAFTADSAGALHVTLGMPVMHCYATPLAPPVERSRDGAYRFDMLAMAWTLAGARIHGTFGLGHLPMTLQRGGRFASEPPAPKFAAAPAPLWTYALGAPTRSTPIVRDGIVYVGALNGRLHAVRAADGMKLWTWEGGVPIDGRPTATDDALFFVDRGFTLVCLDRGPGTLRWKVALHDSALAGGPAPENPTFNRRTTTPLVVDGVVYAGSSDGGVYALDVATGAKRWRCAVGSAVFSGIGRLGSDTLMVGAMDGSVVLLDRASGRELERVHAGGAVVTTPVVAGGRLIVGGRDYRLHAFDLADTTRRWTYSYWFSWVESTPAVAGRTCYVGASDYRRVSAFDAATGRLRWATDVRGMTWGTPVVTERVIYAATAAQNLPGTLIHHEGGIVALDRATGRVKWRFATPPPPENAFGGFAGSPALDDGRLIGAAFDGTLIALPAR